jgi:hypothetical protein
MLLSAFLFAASLSAQSLPFDVCAASTTWVRPSPEVQAKIWNDGRYKDFARTDYAWTHDFIVIDDPLSASGSYHLMNLSGLWTVAPINNKCDTGRNGYEWIEVWSLLHRVTQVTHTDNTYTVTVEPVGKGFQFVYIRRLNPSAVLRFITPDGKELEKLDESDRPDRVKVPPGTRIIGPNGEKIISK